MTRNLVLGLALVLGCHRSPPSAAAADAAPPEAPARKPAAGPVRIQTDAVPVPDDLPAFVVRGAKEHRATMLFVPGMCVHPEGYVQSFQHTAASRGDLVAVQGDVSCGDSFGGRRWSSDLAAMDRRIDAAFRAAGLGEPRGVIVIGYSQGAERAEKLVARFPEKYSAAVLISSPVVPSRALLAKADAVVLMAGEHDLAQGTHPAAASMLKKGAIPATFLTLPGARHGQMGERPEESMRQALDFVEESRRVKIERASPSHEGLPAR